MNNAGPRKIVLRSGVVGKAGERLKNLKIENSIFTLHGYFSIFITMASISTLYENGFNVKSIQERY